MKYFVERTWCVPFFFILDERRPTLPFGICGPFAKKREAKKATSKLRARFPDRDLDVFGTWFAKPCRPGSMMEARTEARVQAKSHAGCLAMVLE